MLQRKLIFVNFNKNYNLTEDLLQHKKITADWQIYHVTVLEEAKVLLAKRLFNVGLLQLPSELDNSFYDALYHVCCIQTQIQWIALLPPNGTKNKALCEAVFTCCYDYHTLPIHIDRLSITLGHAYGMANLSHIAVEPPDDLELNSCSLIGKTAGMEEVKRKITKFAGVEVPLLITGESGTGKELAARMVHARSRRAKKPFIAVNCGALSATLIQSELFGHEKGAFTGAHKVKIGRFEAAQGGTLFLDEIGDLSFDLQVNLLRVLEQGCIERLGSIQPIDVDVRIITATHVDLPQAVAKGDFREDLYYRLNVLNLQMPALRERQEDIELLARFFFTKFRDEINRPSVGFSTQALEAMKHHTWPGNVRELINRICRAMTMCDTRLIMSADLDLKDYTNKSPIIPLEAARSAAEREVIEASLRNTSYNVAQAARKLEISRGTLYKLMEKLCINVRHLVDVDENDEATV